MKIKNILSEKILVLLIIINMISFSNYFLFNLYGRIFFYINLLFICAIILIQKRFYQRDLELIIFLFVFLIYGLLTLFLTGGGIGSVLTPFYSILVYFVIKRTYIGEKNMKILMVAMIVLNLTCIMQSPDYYERWFVSKKEYINSNTLGIVIMYTSIYSSIFLRKLKIKRAKPYILIIYILSVFGILNVQSRGSLLTLTSFIILDTLKPKKIWKNKRFLSFLYIFLIFIGLAIPYIYTKMYNSGLQVDFPFTEKPLYTGREMIWSNFYNTIDTNYLTILFGLGSNADLWSGRTLNLHNNYLGVIANFGVIGFVLYYGFWFMQIRELLNEDNIKNFQISLLIGFFAILINGFFEISTLWHVMFFFNFMFLGLAYGGKESPDIIYSKS